MASISSLIIWIKKFVKLKENGMIKIRKLVTWGASASFLAFSSSICSSTWGSESSNEPLMLNLTVILKQSKSIQNMSIEIRILSQFYFSLSWLLVRVTFGPSVFTSKPVNLGKLFLYLRLSFSCFISCLRNEDKSFKTFGLEKELRNKFFKLEVF